MDGTQDRYTLVRYDSHLSTKKVKGINYKIKVMKRNAYSFRDEKYFKLRLYALHNVASLKMSDESYSSIPISTHSLQKASCSINNLRTLTKLFNSCSSVSFCSKLFPIWPTLKYMLMALSIPLRIVGIS